MPTNQGLTHDQVVSAVKKAIEADIIGGDVPTDIASYDDLHLYVDANDYTDTLVSYTGDIDDWFSRINAVTDEINQWLQSGRLT